MNYTKAFCGHDVIAVGAPGSSARRAAESRHCGEPRCESGLPRKFSDRECAAYVWLRHRGVDGWSVDLLSKSAMGLRGTIWASVTDLAAEHGWEG